MKKGDIINIEKIISDLNELKIMTNGRDDSYFYDGYEMNILCSLVNDIEIRINKISDNIKNKYSDIYWDIIKDGYNLEGNLKLGTIWDLSSGILYNKLYNNLMNILNIELPIYYKNYCDRMHKKAVRKRNLNEENYYKI